MDRLIRQFFPYSSHVRLLLFSVFFPALLRERMAKFRSLKS